MKTAKSHKKTSFKKQEAVDKPKNQIVVQGIVAVLKKKHEQWIATPIPMVANQSAGRGDRGGKNQADLNFLVPDDLVKKNWKSGDFVRLLLDDRRQNIFSLDYLGNWQTGCLEVELSLEQFKLPTTFPDVALREAKALSWEKNEPKQAYRRDLRELAFVTIDGEDARDFDDAVYAQSLLNKAGKSSGAARLWVAIADVAHYVKPHSAIDLSALWRGTSVYFPRKVIPMLPEVLSNDLCSLRPNEDRLVLVCEMEVSAYGNVVSHQFYEATIHSKARLTYGQVQDYLDSSNTLRSKKKLGADAAVQNNVDTLYKTYLKLLKQREKRGALDIDSQELMFTFDAKNRIDNMVARKRYAAHRLIEECMLAANVSAAQWIEAHEHTVLYRVHEAPSAKKILALNETLHRLGFATGVSEQAVPIEFLNLAKQFADHPLKDFLNIQLLRAQMQARYTPNNLGHFGLAYSHYTHFTSPIRRYPDLLVHRVIKALLHQQRYSPEMSKQLNQQIEKELDINLEGSVWDKIGTLTSMTERRAEEASRRANGILKCVFAQRYLGEVFEATIVSVLAFGFFVKVQGLDLEGLVHISSLRGYFWFDEVKQALFCRVRDRERSKKSTSSKTSKSSDAKADQPNSFFMGQSVWVQLASANPFEQKIDFVLVTPPDTDLEPHLTGTHADLDDQDDSIDW